MILALKYGKASVRLHISIYLGELNKQCTCMISYSQFKLLKVRRIMKMLQESEFQALYKVIICLLCQKFSLRHERCF